MLVPVSSSGQDSGVSGKMYLQKGKMVDRQRRRWKKVKNSRGNTKVRERGEVLYVGVDIPCRLWKTGAGEEEI